MQNWIIRPLKQTVAFALCAVLLLTLFGCDSEKRRFEKIYIDYFDTVITVIGYEYENNTFDEVCAELENELCTYNRLFDIYNTYDGINNICTVNRNAGKAVVPVDEELIDFLLFSKEMYSLTEGSVNIAFGGVLSVWHAYRTTALNDPENAAVPDFQVLYNASQHCSIEDVVIDADKSEVFLKDPKLSLDVGALAKGYALEKISRKLKDGYAINMGGTVKATGVRADGKPWSVGIEDPSDKENTVCAVTPNNMSVITSGTYQRYYEVNGVRYHHIISPKTLMPENEYMSVTVLTESSALGDALSTALFNLSLEDGRRILDSLSGEISVMWILSGGTREYYGSFENYIV